MKASGFLRPGQISWNSTAFIWRVLIFFSLGIWLSRVLRSPPYLAWTAACIWMFVCLWRTHAKAGWPYLALLLILLGATGFSVYWYGVESDHQWLTELPGDIEVVGRIRDITPVVEFKRSLVLEIEGIISPTGFIPGKGKAQITQVFHSDEQLSLFEPGQWVKAEGAFYFPQKAGNPGQFDYGNYLRRRGIGIQAYIQGNAGLTNFNCQEFKGSAAENILSKLRFGLLSKADACRRRLVRVWYGLLPTEVLGLFSAMVVGDKSLLSKETETAFSITGQAHLLSVSGLHVSFIAGIVWMLAGKLPFSVFVKGLLASLGVWAYALVAGLGMPVTRAAVVLTLHFVAVGLGRDQNRFVLTGWAALIQLCFNPSLLFDTSFQLSYGALLGLLYLAPIIKTCLFTHLSNGFLDYFADFGKRVCELVIVSCSAQLALFPLLVNYFHGFPWIGILLSIITIPLAGIIVPFAFFASVLGLWYPLSVILAPLVRTVLGILMGIVKTCSAWPWIHVKISPGRPILWIVYYAVLVLLGRHLKRKIFYGWLASRNAGFGKGRKTHWGVFAAVALITVYYPVLAPFWRPLEIVFLDVGQGDAIFIKTPSRRTMLVDGGGFPPKKEGRFDVGENILLPYLEARGIKKLDAVIATHMHNDHTHGLGAVLRAMPVDLLGDNGLFDAGFASLEYKAALQNSLTDMEAERKVFRRGHYFDLDRKMRVLVLYPTGFAGTTVSEKVLDQNNNSIVLKLVTPYYSVLLTGDVDRLAQEDLLQWDEQVVDGRDFTLKADLLKVPHHGSRQALSYPFLSKVSPKEAVISVGSNPFGHPTEEYLHALEVVGCSPWRTDELGAITVKIRGKQCKIFGYRSKPFWVLDALPFVQVWEEKLEQFLRYLAGFLMA